MSSVNISASLRLTIRKFCNYKLKHFQLHFKRDLRGRPRLRTAEHCLNEEEVLKQARPNSSANKLDFMKEARSQSPKGTTILQNDELVDSLEITADNQFTLLADKVTPLHGLPYDIQLKKKFYMNLKVLKKFGKSLEKCGAQIAMDADKIPCVLDPILPSPVTESYRNKDEFSIRHGVDGDPKTVGFYLSSPSGNHQTICVGPDHLLIIRKSHKQLAHLFQSYIQESPLPACHNFNEGGFWRNLIVRSNSEGDVMGIVIMHPQQLTQDQLLAEMNSLKEKLILPNAEKLQLKSFYFQACRHTKCTHQQAPFQLLFGEPYITEEMNGVKYRLSPESFFQTNTAAASQLYKVIFNASQATKRTTILDICCGVGPVSFTFAPHVKRCIAIDSSAEAIKDAKMNAEINGIKNVEFHYGRCEYVLENILNEIYAEELIAVLNPSRSALGKHVIRILRECKHLKKILFVSCKPEAAIDNFTGLCETATKRSNLGSPFYPMRAVPVDLFPQTQHCELVFLFKRLEI